MSEMRDPAYAPDRACNGVHQDLFFPAGSQARRMARARELCGGCPILAGCAAWAAPLAETGALVGCVVGGVYLPEPKRPESQREQAVADLAYVARTGRLVPTGSTTSAAREGAA